MNKAQIITKYKNRKNNVPRLLFGDGSVAIGEEIDEENHLYYVIQKPDGNIIVDYAGNHRFISNLIPFERVQHLVANPIDNNAKK